MATSGSITSSVKFGSYKLTLTRTSVDIANNCDYWTAKLSYTLQAYGKIVASATQDLTVTINGTKYTSTYKFGTIDNSSNSNPITKTIWTKTGIKIPHDNDGTKTFSISYSANINITYGGTYISSTSKSGSITADTIPRKSTMTVANGTLGTAQTLTVTRNSTSFTHTITATCGSASTTICTKSTSTSISFTPPLAWASQNTTGTSVSVKFTITTYNGSTSIGSNSYTKTCSIPSSVKPSCTITVSEATSYGAYVKGLSKAKIVVTPTLAYGSSIASYSVAANGTSYTTSTVTTGALSTSGTMTITATVKDNRGRTATATTTITVVDKSTLSVGGGTLGTAQTVSLTKGHSSFKHKITYTCGSASGYIAGSSSEFTTATSVSWTPPLSLSSQNITGTSVTATVCLKTYTSNGTHVGNVTKTINLSIPSSVVPSISSIKCSEATSDLSSLGVYVQNKSTLKVTISASGSYSSTIKSYSTKIDGTTYSGSSFTSYILRNSGTITITTTVTDSRGRTASKSTTVTVYDYFTPKITYFTVERCLSDGTLSDEGTYVKCTHSYEIAPLNNKNTKVWKFQYHNGSDWVDLKTATTQIYSSNKSTYTETTKTFSADSSYKFRLYVADYFSSTTWEREVSTSFRLMNYNASGKGLAIGKKSEKNAFEVGLPTEFNESVAMDKNLNLSGYLFGKIDLPPYKSLADALATSNNNFLLPFHTNSSSLDLPANTNEWQYSVGFLISRASTIKQKWIVIFGNGSGRIAINHFANETWSGWKFLNPS